MQRAENRDGMHIDWDVPISMDDGVVLRADIFRPTSEGRYPGHIELRPLCKGARIPGRVQRQLGPADQGCARGAAGVEQ